jgi:hypothetical protein
MAPRRVFDALTCFSHELRYAGDRFHFDYKAYGIAGRRRPFQHERLLVLGQQRPD